MKRILLSIGLLGLLALPAFGQYFTTNSAGAFIPITLNTNGGSGPFFSGPIVDVLKDLSTATNWGFGAFSIIRPKAGNNPMALGGGAVALYNFNKFVGTGVGVDVLNNRVTMPSAQFQLQAPINLGGTNGVRATFFGLTGIATSVAGQGDDNYTVVGLFGGGLDVRIYKGLGLFYCAEYRTGEPTLWHLVGVRWAFF